jgi:hypothetical protein
MKTCKDCIHFNACEDWAHNWGIEGLEFPWECSDDDNLCDSYNPQTLPPAYIGMKVWVPYVWVFKEVMTDLREGHVSGLQQKADKSWKIRVTRCGSVADYTVEEFHKYCFLNKEDAEKYIEEKVKELSDESRTT